MKFPNLQNGLRNVLSAEREKVVREEKFIKEEPDRLESALRRCKKLTGTLVTLKRHECQFIFGFPFILEIILTTFSDHQIGQCTRATPSVRRTDKWR